MKERIQKILDAASPHDQAELKLAHNGLVTAMQAYQNKAGKQTKDDWDSARLMLDETLERLSAKYFPDEVKAPEGERFANRKQALNWLNAQNYKVSQGKFYQDCAAGFPAMHRDGTVSRYQVLQYGQQLDVETRGAAPLSTGSDADDARRSKAEADMAVMKAEKMRREHDEDWLHAHDAWASVAALVGALRDSLRHHFHTGQGTIIHLAGGDPARGPEVYEGLEEIMASAFNEVCATGQINGVFEVEREV